MTNMTKKKKKSSRLPKKAFRRRIKKQTTFSLKEVPIKRQQRFQRARGMHDILPEEWDYYDFVYRTAESVLRSYDFSRLETPLVEDVNLFSRAIGQTTDIVSKEMFEIRDRGSDKLALRPEFTAGVARAYIENGMASKPQPIKLYSLGPLFRAERPQAGRYRQFHQINIETIGGDKPALDAQIIAIVWRILERIGLSNVVIQLNSIGCPDCRPEYRQALVDYYRPHINKLCADCKKRLKSNPLRLLDCKEDKCQRVAVNAPQMFDNLCEPCHNHFKQLLEMLDEIDVPYELNPRIVRGLDYYRRTVFEVWPADVPASGLAQSSYGGGGRYDGLIELLGGQPTPAVGVGLGVERLITAMKESNFSLPQTPAPRVFLAQLGEKAKKLSFNIFEDLYKGGIDVIESIGRDSLKSQLKQAEKKAVLYTLILGQKEAVDKTIIIRDMETGVQEVVTQENMIKYLHKGLDKKEAEKKNEPATDITEKK
jgi:histidyl-tRNA synthetase